MSINTEDYRRGPFPVRLTITDGTGDTPAEWVPDDGETVISAANEAREQGYPVDASDPLSWLNSASIRLNPDDDSVDVSISTDDPRGAFVMRIRRIPLDAPDNAGRLVMVLPYPGEPMPHEDLREINPGTYMIEDLA